MIKVISEQEKLIQYFFLGDVIFFEIFNSKEENVTFNLEEFLKTLRNPLGSEEEILLMGVVAFHGIGGSITRQNERSTSGHYTALGYRRGNASWMEVDDLKTKTIFRSEKNKIVPRLLMYVKRKK